MTSPSPPQIIAAGRRSLRSADNRTCLVKRSRNQYHAGSTLWNSLTEQLRQPDITFGVRTIQMIAENVYVWLSDRGALRLNVKGAN